MSEAAGFDNAMAWAQFRLRGGWRTVIFWGTAVPAALAFLSVLAVFSLPSGALRGGFYGGLMFLTGIQGAVLIVIGASQVGGAVQRDMTSGMIASHRLMPISGIEAVAGYIVGSLAGVLAAAGSFFLLGLALAAGAQVPMQHWLMANLILAVFALLCWCGAVCAALQLPFASRFGGVIALLVVSGYGVAWLIPGLMVLAGPVIGRSVFGVVERGAALDSTYALSFFAQILLAVLFFAGAARKYRRQDVLTFTPWMGLAAVAMWAVASMVGTLGWGGFKSAWFDEDPSTQVMHAITACVAGMLLGLLPVTACARIATRYHRRPDMRAVTGVPVPPAAACLLGTLILTTIPGVILAEQVSADRLARTALVFAAVLFSAGYLARIIYRRADKAQWPLALWLTLTWLAPPAADLARAMYASGAYGSSPSAGIVTTFSPSGALALIWSGHKIDTTRGIGFQLMLAVAMAGLFEYGRRARAARTKAAESSATGPSGHSAGGSTAGP